jgi:NAD(P) transhydrogenase subunit alpha
MILDIAAGQISMRHGFRGPNYAVVSACASSTNAIIEAFDTIRLNKADIIITTAQIPGKKAPLLITDAMLDVMRNGSVVIDLAAATGGNTEHTKPDETIIYKGVRIVGNSRLPSTLPADASKLYGKNILNFLQLIITKDGALNINLEDDLVKGTLITHSGAIVNDQLR